MSKQIEVCVIVGHEPNDGARNAELNIWEYDLNLELANDISEELTSRGIKNVVIFRPDSYSKLPSLINKLNPKYFISVHHNGAENPSVNGTETLFWHSSLGSTKSQGLAQCLNDSMVKVLGYRDRGLKAIKKGHNGWPLLKYTNMVGVLIEPYFTTNAKAVKNREPKKLAIALVDGYCKFRDKL